MKYSVKVRYVLKYDVDTARPGVEEIFTKEELSEVRVGSDWDYVCCDDAVSAADIFVKRIKAQKEAKKLCEKYQIRFTNIEVSECHSRKGGF